MEAKKKHSCRYCQYKSIKKGDMDRHVMAVHEKENARMFYCGKCNYKTCRRGHLNKHSRTHEEFRLLKCEDCSKEFNEKRQLDGHILKHHPHIAHTITSKIHSCDICGFKSVSKSHLTDHKYQHNKENAPKFHCTQCEFSSNRKGNLKRHLLTHLAGNPYVCSECKIGFNQKLQLDSHILNRHKDNEQLLRSISSKIHSCSLCEYQSIRLSLMKTHLKRHKYDRK
ncbi:hypothetical protein JTB14_003131 [Gonioctena quinquepunctata]|nr:hypothetical protein JTB14_003131 [Gonioctena quinquepunctata]